MLPQCVDEVVALEVSGDGGRHELVLSFGLISAP